MKVQMSVITVFLSSCQFLLSTPLLRGALSHDVPLNLLSIFENTKSSRNNNYNAQSPDSQKECYYFTDDQLLLRMK